MSNTPMHPLRRLTLALASLPLLVGGGCRHGRPLAPQKAPISPAVRWPAVDSAMGRTATVQAGDVHRYGIPRSDLTVTVRDPRGDVVLKAAFALGGWIAMHETGNGGDVMAMGDLVVTDDELPRVISRLQDGGVDQTAVHHHVIRESPRLLYVHVSAHGDPVRIAQVVRAAVALTGAPSPAGQAAPTAPALGIDTIAVAQLLGAPGRSTGGVFQFNIPRPEVIREHGMSIPGAMGLGTAVNFQPTGNGRAAITGDFVLTAAEVNPVIRALRAHAIEVTSVHNHMLDDQPRLFFMHFWANDDATKLARGLREALDSTALRR